MPNWNGGVFRRMVQHRNELVRIMRRLRALGVVQAIPGNLFVGCEPDSFKRLHILDQAAQDGES